MPVSISTALFKLFSSVVNIADPIIVLPSTTLDASTVNSDTITIYEELETGEQLAITNFTIEKIFNYNNKYVQSFKVLPDSPLTHNKDYTLVLNGIYDSSNRVVPKVILRFLGHNPDIARNSNDVYYKLSNLDKLTSIDDIVLNGDFLDFNINPVKYNLITKTYEPDRDINQDLVTLDITNKDLVLDLYVSEYLDNYKNYFNDIINRKQLGAYTYNETLSEDDVKKLELLLIKNISKLNVIKGNEQLMEFVLGIYAKVLGYQLISVIEDKNFNFVYRISTSIPQPFWQRNIKPIVHPAGWGDIYNYIDSILNDWQLDFQKERINYLAFIRRMFEMTCLSYLEVDYYIIKWAKFKRFVHLYGNVEVENGEKHGQFGHSFISNEIDTYNQNLHNTPATHCNYIMDENDHEYNMDWAGEHKDLNYYRITKNDPIKEQLPYGLIDLRELYDPANNKFRNDRTINRYDVRFKKGGIGIEYLYKTYFENTLVQIDRDPWGRYGITHKTNDDYGHNRYRTVLTLKHNWWEKEVYQYDSINHIPYKGLIEHWAGNSQRYRYLNVHCNDEHHASVPDVINKVTQCYGNLNLGNFTSQYHLNKIVDMKNCYDDAGNRQRYQFFDNSFTADNFRNEFDHPNIFGVSLVSQGASAVKIKVTYKKPGLATKYTWKLYSNVDYNTGQLTLFSNNVTAVYNSPILEVGGVLTYVDIVSANPGNFIIAADATILALFTVGTSITLEDGSSFILTQVKGQDEFLDKYTEFVTYFNSVEFSVPSNNLNNYKLVLTITYRDGCFVRKDYTLQNYLIFGLNEFLRQPKMLDVVIPSSSLLSTRFNNGFNQPYVGRFDWNNTVESYHSQFAHKENITAYTASANYSVAASGFFTEIESNSNFETVAVTAGGVVNYNVKYKLGGIALRYLWEIYDGAELINIYTTYLNKVEFDIPLALNYTMQLRLVNNDFDYRLAPLTL